LLGRENRLRPLLPPLRNLLGTPLTITNWLRKDVGRSERLTSNPPILVSLDNCLDSQTTATNEPDTLRIATELIEQLKISRFRPVTVSWAEDVPWTFVESEKTNPESAGLVKRDVPIGWCVFTWDRVILPAGMKGKLDPEEWRPLLASSLIYEAILSLRRNLGFVILSTPIMIDALGWWELLAVSAPVSGIPALLLILDVAGLFGALALSGLLAKRFSRRLRLRADTLAAELVGRQALETVLEKMKAQGLVDSYAGVTWGGGYPFSSELMNGRPSLAERITNLKRTR
jgi:hypothetical protein